LHHNLKNLFLIAKLLEAFNNMHLIKHLTLGSCLIISQLSFAHGPRPPKLTGVPVPPVPGLLDGSSPIVINKDKAIALGKALFWDINVGSDGMACASCHFHAGADRRVKNQLNPGEKNQDPSGQTFENTLSGTPGGPNYTLTSSDFPFFKLANPLLRTDHPQNSLTFSTDDVASSSGTFSGEFNSAPRVGDNNDDCSRSADPVFHVNSTGTRRVEPRNTPTVINAVFNHRNFWDGRANNIFNGSSIWGDRDPDPATGVWVKINGRTVVKQRLHLINSSLASQALAPPLSDSEMGCRQRIFPDLGRKLLSRRPLEHQNIHHQDSVLGALSQSSANNLQPGLNTTYTSLIKEAFNNKYWSYRRRGSFGGPAGELPYTQMEANFAMFFGLAIQLYESTLISDQAPIDTAPRNPVDYSPAAEAFFPTEEAIGSSAYNGLKLFIDFHCNLCHVGPTLTSAALTTNADLKDQNPEAYGSLNFINDLPINHNLVTRENYTKGRAMMDAGFFNTGVGNPGWDPGIDNVDDFGNPLSFTAQFKEYLAGNPSGNGVVDPGLSNIRPCDFLQPLSVPSPNTFIDFFSLADGLIADPNGNTDCFLGSAFAIIPTPAAAESELQNPGSPKMASSITAAFKVPTLRNVELTGPYMHNGSMKTLDEVIEFYARGGNIKSGDTHDNILEAGELQLIPQSRTDLIAFLKLLTDERVRLEQAPFDHPELPIPNGHQGNHISTTAGNPLDTSLAKDEMLIIPAVGTNGLNTPILPFEDYLQP
jgi:cytochrome c peroxidase